jgi:hypothetical protein
MEFFRSKTDNSTVPLGPKPEFCPAQDDRRVERNGRPLTSIIQKLAAHIMTIPNVELQQF